MTDTVRELADRAAVADTVTRMTWYLDRRDWDGLTANVVGVHRLTNPHGAPLWTVGGTYDFRLVRTGDGWRRRSQT